MIRQKLQDNIARRVNPLLIQAAASFGDDYTGSVTVEIQLNMTNGGLNAVRLATTKSEQKG